MEVGRFSFKDMMKRVDEAAALAAETHKKNGGMCQLCGKEKADYPNGRPNSYHCQKCNAKTAGIIQELRGMGGFTTL